MLVTSGTESLVADTGEDDYSDFRGGAAIVHRVEHLEIGLRAEGVVDLRTVDCYFCDSSELLEEDILIFFYGFPVTFHCGICIRLLFNFLLGKYAGRATRGALSRR